MITVTLALAVLFVWAFARVALAAFSQKTIRSLDLEYQRRDGVDSPEGSRCSFAFCELTSAATAHVFELGTAQTLNGWSRSEARSAREDFRAARILCV